MVDSSLTTTTTFHGNLRHRKAQGSSIVRGPTSSSQSYYEPHPNYDDDEQPSASHPLADQHPFQWDPNSHLLYTNANTNGNRNTSLFLPDTDTNDSSSSSSSMNTTTNRSLEHDRGAHYDMDLPWWNGGALILCTIFSIVLLYLLKYTAFKVCGLDFCGDQDANGYRNHGTRGLNLNSNNNNNNTTNTTNGRRVHPHTPRTEEEQQQLEEQLQAQRAERRKWYQYYLQPYTRTLTKADFCHSKHSKNNVDLELGGGVAHEPEEVGVCSATTADCHDDDIMEEEVVGNDHRSTMDVDNSIRSVSIHHQRSSSAVLSLHDDHDDDNEEEHEEVGVDPPLAVVKDSFVELDDFSGSKHLVVWDGNTRRHLEAECIICLLDYEEGDVIVQSAVQDQTERCMHCFHYECIMAWLVKGKKHCPYCRNWFVPSMPIQDQMKQIERQTGLPIEQMMMGLPPQPLETHVEDEADANDDDSELQNDDAEEASHDNRQEESGGFSDPSEVTT